MAQESSTTDATSPSRTLVTGAEDSTDPHVTSTRPSPIVATPEPSPVAVHDFCNNTEKLKGIFCKSDVGQYFCTNPPTVYIAKAL